MEEKLLIQQLQDPQSRDAAFQLLIKTHQEALYWHIRRIVIDHDDAHDVMQNTFIKVWKNIVGFRGESKLKTWLYRIATNESLTFLSKKKKHVHMELGSIEDHLSHSVEHGPLIDGDEIQMKLQQALLTLPEKQRLVFNMKYFDEMKYTEIVEVLGGTVGSLKASYHHAVKKIEKFIKSN